MAGLLVQLNADWRVSDDPPQWALQCRDGHAREKASGWAGRKFIRDRDHLLRRISESCGEVDPAAVMAGRLRDVETTRNAPPRWPRYRPAQRDLVIGYIWVTPGRRSARCGRWRGLIEADIPVSAVRPAPDVKPAPSNFGF